MMLAVAFLKINLELVVPTIKTGIIPYCNENQYGCLHCQDIIDLVFETVDGVTRAGDIY
jgi:hypothetical protein